MVEFQNLERFFNIFGEKTKIGVAALWYSPKTSTIQVTVGRGIRVFTSSSGGNSGFASFDFNWKVSAHHGL